MQEILKKGTFGLNRVPALATISVEHGLYNRTIFELEITVNGDSVLTIKKTDSDAKTLTIFLKNFGSMFFDFMETTFKEIEYNKFSTTVINELTYARVSSIDSSIQDPVRKFYKWVNTAQNKSFNLDDACIAYDNLDKTVFENVLMCFQPKTLIMGYEYYSLYRDNNYSLDNSALFLKDANYREFLLQAWRAINSSDENACLKTLNNHVVSKRDYGEIGRSRINPVLALPIKTKKVRDYLLELKVSDFKKLFHVVPSNLSAQSAIAMMNTILSESHNDDKGNKTSVNVTLDAFNAISRIASKFDDIFYLKALFETLADNHKRVDTMSFVKDVVDGVTFEEKTDVNAFIALIFGNKVKSWVKPVSAAEYVVSQLLKLQSPEDVLETLRGVSNEETVLTSARWQKYFDNYEEKYSGLPPAWWMPLIK